MARGFNSTLGSGSTDVIQTGFSTAFSAKHSVFAWVYVRAFTGSLSKVFNVGATGSTPYLGVQSGSVQLQEPFSTTNGIWQVNSNFSNGAWHSLCMTYDGSSTSNIPKIYYDGVSQSVSTVTSPAGTYNSSSTGLNVGNSSTANRVLDGMLAEFALWNGVILTASEVAALAKGVPPLLMQRASLSLYLPLFGTQTNEPDWGPSHVTQSITGTKNQDHAPVSFWMPTTPLAMPAFYQGSLALAQGAAGAALGAHEKFSASLAITEGALSTAIAVSEKFRATAALTQPNAALSITGAEKFSHHISLTAPANLALIYGSEIAANYPGSAIIGDAAQGGLLALGDQPAYGLALTDTALYDVQITESV